MGGATPERVRASELMAALSLAADYAQGHPREYGLQSTLVAMRLCDRLGVDTETASHTYYACLLFYVGCTADAEVAAELFPAEDALASHFTPAMFGSQKEVIAGLLRALATPDRPAAVRTAEAILKLPRARRHHEVHMVAICEVAQMLCEEFGMPADVRALFAHLTERWDGKGVPGGVRGEEIPLALRIAHVARDATFQSALCGADGAAAVIASRAGGAFDPAIAGVFASEAEHILVGDGGSCWRETMAAEPRPWLELGDDAVDRALAAIGHFADLASPWLAGHSSGVADLAEAAARHTGLSPADVVLVRRAALLHDVGRVGVPVRMWQKAGPLTADEWERVRLHAYHTERILTGSAFLAPLAEVAAQHHERLDGSGYHRASSAPALPPAARLVAAADVYCALREPRPYREAAAPERAVEIVAEEARQGRLDADAVASVVRAAGQRPPRLDRPAGLTARETDVLKLLARGYQTKQIARALAISAKTADRHVQHAYEKIGVSTRAAATLFAMRTGLVTWGELPIGAAEARS